MAPRSFFFFEIFFFSFLFRTHVGHSRKDLNERLGEKKISFFFQLLSDVVETTLMNGSEKKKIPCFFLRFFFRTHAGYSRKELSERLREIFFFLELLSDIAETTLMNGSGKRIFFFELLSGISETTLLLSYMVVATVMAGSRRRHFYVIPI